MLGDDGCGSRCAVERTPCPASRETGCVASSDGHGAFIRCRWTGRADCRREEKLGLYVSREERSRLPPPPVFDCGLIINVNVRHETLTCNQDAAVNRSHFRRREIDRFRRSSTEDTWGFANFYRCSCLCWSKSERLEATAQAYVSVGAA